eukprot:7271409-Prymnesium_polylepis.2
MGRSLGGGAVSTCARWVAQAMGRRCCAHSVGATSAPPSLTRTSCTASAGSSPAIGYASGSAACQKLYQRSTWRGTRWHIGARSFTLCRLGGGTERVSAGGASGGSRRARTAANAGIGQPSV